jgi:hypothetical protein
MGKKKEIEIQTTRHIFLGDLIGTSDPHDVWGAVQNSDVSFGSNADTMIDKTSFGWIMDNGDVPEKYQKKILAMIPDDGVFISLGS